MSVKVKLADARQVVNSDGDAVAVQAGQVVEVSEGTARVLERQNIAAPVHPNTKVTAQKTAADAATDGK